ncbi:murein biosynthesis integral membrane protein MurJ [Candidatus Uhrbacteria bacterium]|nr:MAG: murein biosynthesis integral membrane protein MurJ [Candidatus Uhrbacteria bacterium]
MITFFKKWMAQQTDGLTAAAFIVGASSFASRLLGILRDRALAGTFGAGAELDAYYAAFRLPDIAYNLVVLGAVSAGFIPVFTSWMEREGRESALRLASRVFAAVGATLALASLAIVALAPLLVPLIAPGFSGESLDLAIRLTRVMAISPILLGLSAVVGGVMQSMRRFVGFALAPVFYNLGIIGGTVLLSPTLGVYGAALGVVAGAFLHLLVQLSAAHDVSFWPIVKPDFADPGMRRILVLMGPRIAALGVSQVSFTALIAIATITETGAVAVFNLANNLQSFPLGLFGISFAIAAFPMLSRAAAAGDDEGYRVTLSAASRRILFFVLPATAVFFLLRAQIVRLVLGGGVFSWEDTIRVADMLGLMALSLVAQSLVPLLVRALYARQDTWTPFRISLASESVTIAAAWFLHGSLGLRGIGVAFSLGAFVQAVILLSVLRKRFGKLGKGQTLYSFYRTTIATVALCVVGFPVREWLGTIYRLETFWQVALQAVGTIAFGGGAFLVTAWLMRSPELEEIANGIRSKFVRRANLTEGAEQAG